MSPIGFDAGSLTAHLKLDRSEFQRGLEEAKAEAKAFEESGVTLKAAINKAEFDVDAQEIKATSDELKKPVTKKVSIDLNLPGLAAQVAEADALLRSIGTGGAASIGSEGGLIQTLIGQGADTKATLAETLSALGYSKEEAQSAITKFAADATALGRSARTAFVDAFASAFSAGAPALTAGSGAPMEVAGFMEGVMAEWRQVLTSAPNWATYMAELPQFAGGISGVLGTGSGGGGLTLPGLPWGNPQNWATDSLFGYGPSGGGNMVPVPPGIGDPFSGATGGASAASSFGGSGATQAGESLAAKFAKAWRTAAKKDLQEAEYSIFQKMGDGGLGSPWKVLFKGTKGVETELRSWAKKAGVTVGDDFIKAMGKGATDAAKAATSGGGWMSTLAQTLVGGAGKAFSGITSAAGGLSGPMQALLGLGPILAPLMGAFGAAGGGALAGTAIASGGLLAALLPGLLGATKVSAAYSALVNGTSTAGMAPGAISVAQQLIPIISSGKGALGQLENMIFPYMGNLVGGVGAALPSFMGFSQAGITQFGSFINQLSSDLKSPGFKSFMTTMTKDVKPLMKDFGKVVQNLTSAFGSFLKLFGGKPAQMVGKWFVQTSKEFAGFVKHAKLGPGFLSGMKTAFSFLASLFQALWTAVKKVADALAPIGLNMMKVLTPALAGLNTVINKIPVNVLTAVALGIGAIVVASSPLLLVIAGLAGLGLAVNAISNAMKPLPPALTGTQLTTAAQAAWTPAGKRTPAQKSALAAAEALGLSPAQITGAYAATQTGRTGAGLTSTTDTGVFGNSGANQATRHRQADAAKALTPPKRTGWKLWGNAIGQSLVDVWHALELAGNKITTWFTQTIPHNFHHFINFWKKGWHDVQHWANLSWQWVDNHVIHPLVSFFASKIPHAFNHFINFWKKGWQDAKTEAGSAWHWVYNHVLHPLDTFFTQTIPKGFDAFTKFWKDLPGDLQKWAGQAWSWLFTNVLHPIDHFFSKTIPGDFSSFLGFWKKLPGHLTKALSGIANLIVSPFKTAFNMIATVWDSTVGGMSFKIPSWVPFVGGKGFSIPKMPHYSAGGWVTAAPGVPQLAVVHGGEFVMSQAMIRGGASPFGGGRPVTINVDARGATDPAATQRAATGGVHSALPALRQAFERGAA